MKTRMFFGWVKSALLGVVIAGAAAVIALDICLLVGVDSFMTSVPAVAWVSMVAGIIVLVAALLILFNSYYSFKDEGLKMTLGFFCDKLEYENIVGIKQNSVNKDIFIIYKTDKVSEAEQAMRMNLQAKSADKILDNLRKYCPFIIVELFTPPEKKKKDK